MRIVVVCAFLIGILTIVPVGSAQATAPDCLTYAYVHDGWDHYSHVKDGSVLMGSTLFVTSSCDGEFYFEVDGQLSGLGNHTGVGSISPGQHNLTVYFENHNITWSNLTVYPALDFGVIMQGVALDGPEGEFVTDEQMSSRELMVSITSIAFALVGSVFVVDRIAKHRADRAPLEEEGA